MIIGALLLIWEDQAAWDGLRQGGGKDLDARIDQWGINDAS